jgi:hypothetical protein
MSWSKRVALATSLVVAISGVSAAEAIFFTFEWLGDPQRLAGFEIRVLPPHGHVPVLTFEMPADAPCDPALNPRSGARCGYIACLPSGSYDLVAVARSTSGEISPLSNRDARTGHQRDPLCQDTAATLFTGHQESPAAPPLPPSPPPVEAPHVPNVVNLRCPFAKT